MLTHQFSSAFSHFTTHPAFPDERAQESVLRLAMLAGDMETIEKCAQAPTPYVAASGLYMAADLGWLEVIELFLPHYKGDHFGRNAYQRAVSNGHLACLKALSTVYPEEVCVNGLNTAITMGHLECVQWLVSLQKKILPIAQILTLDRKDVRFLQALITPENPPTENLFSRAASRGHLGCIEYLLPLLSESVVTQSKALIHAADEGHVEVVKYLLEHTSIDPKMDESEALHFASLSGHLDCVKVLFPISDYKTWYEEVWQEMNADCAEWMKAEISKSELKEALPPGQEILKDAKIRL